MLLYATNRFYGGAVGLDGQVLPVREPRDRLRLSLRLGGDFAVTPVVRVRYVGASFDGYTEGGSTADQPVAARTFQDIEERAEAKLSHTTVFAPRQAVTWTAHAGVLGLQRLGDTTVNTVLLGANLPFGTPGKNSVGGAFGGLGFDWRTQNVTWFAATEYLAMSDSSCDQRQGRPARRVLTRVNARRVGALRRFAQSGRAGLNYYRKSDAYRRILTGKIGAIERCATFERIQRLKAEIRAKRCT